MALFEPSGLGGICHYTWELAEALARRGCRVLLATSDQYELANLPRHFRVEYLFHRSRIRRALGSFARFALRRRPAATAAGTAGARAVKSKRTRLVAALRRLRLRFLETQFALSLASRRVDVVHFQSIRRGRDLYLVRLLSRLGIAIFYTAHDVLPHEGEQPATRRSLARVYAAADRVIVHAQANRLEILSLFALEPRRVAVIPHGGYRLLLPQEPVSRESARDRVGFPQGSPLVLFFGLVKRYKGLEYLLEAFRRVEREVPGATLAVVGNVYAADREAHARHTKLLAEATRRTSVISVPSYVPLDRVGFYLAAADVIALPYVRTYQSGVLLAAFAAGRPVVVTDTGGLSEVVRDGETGLVVPPRDSEALADALVRLLRDPALAAEMGRAAARRSETDYAWDTIAARTCEAYESVLIERRTARRKVRSLALESARGRER